MLIQSTRSSVPISLPVVAYPEDGSILPVKRYEWRTIELAPVEPDRNSLAGKKILVIGGTEEEINRISDRLHAYGAEAFLYNLVEDQDEARLLEMKKQIGRLDGMIDFNMDEAFSLTEGQDWERAFARTFRVIQAFYEEWAEETDARRLFYVAVTQMGGQMGYDRQAVKQPLGGIWAGLAKSLPREIPNCNAKVIDIGPRDKDQLDELLVRELYHWGVFEVGYQDGIRYGLYAEHAPLGQAVHSLHERDTVLISGGSRGIGFALARQLAEYHGCRVVVTGRDALPSRKAAWLKLTDEQFKQYQYDRMRSIAPGESIADLRKQFAGMNRQRQLAGHMEQVKNDGLRIDYVPCDFTDPKQVKKLIAKLGDSLSGVIHNAGIEETVRFNQKRFEDCAATIRIKVNGFIHLAAAVQGKELTFFCSVGSLSGRWGGMIGQIDYSAANEALTRLGFWASAAASLQVQTICWPTWDRLGLITNYRAALKYASAIHVEEGIYHWHKNLLSGTTGECIYMGKVGKALVPMQVNGFLPYSIIEAPDIERIHSQVFYLGEVQEFRLFHSIRSISRIDRRTTACLDDIWLDGQPIVPVSIILEYGISLAEWVVPEGWLDIELTSLQQVRFNLRALSFPREEETYVLAKRAAGAWNGDQWVVTVTLEKLSSGSVEFLGSFQLVYSKPEHVKPAEFIAANSQTPQPTEASRHPNNAAASSWTWLGHIFTHARTHTAKDGRTSMEVPSCSGSNLWTVPHLPTIQLPVNLLENSWRTAWLRWQSTRSAEREQLAQLSIGSVYVWPAKDSKHYLIYNEDRWLGINQSGQVVIRLEHINFLGSNL